VSTPKASETVARFVNTISQLTRKETSCYLLLAIVSVMVVERPCNCISHGSRTTSKFVLRPPLNSVNRSLQIQFQCESFVRGLSLESSHLLAVMTNGFIAQWFHRPMVPSPNAPIARWFYILTATSCGWFNRRPTASRTYTGQTTPTTLTKACFRSGISTSWKECRPKLRCRCSRAMVMTHTTNGRWRGPLCDL
jgi:hypothetical protein